jgi:ribonucleoside-triphosphate reductase
MKKNKEAGKQMMSESKFYMGYSRWNEDKMQYESWDAAVERVMQMHREMYKDKMTPYLAENIDFAEKAYKEKLVLGAQRALQFGGKQLMQHMARAYNCSVSHCDRSAFFNETFYLLLCGCGVGFSVQKHHVSKLPMIKKRSEKKVKIFHIPDSIEGWADAVAVLLSSYMQEDAVFPEYKNYQVHFDFSKIRPKGAMISGGFKAPGPDGLRAALEKIEALIESQLTTNEPIVIKPIVAYDIVMHISDAVLSGGVRRSATICMFDKTDTEMLNAKTGNWYATNPQRGRSNNSVMLKREELTREEWKTIMQSVKDYGEPGFIFTDNLEFAYNPLKLAA